MASRLVTIGREHMHMQFSINADKTSTQLGDETKYELVFNVTNNTTLIRIVRCDGRGGTQGFAVDTLALLDNFDEARREREAMI